MENCSARRLGETKWPTLPIANFGRRRFSKTSGATTRYQIKPAESGHDDVSSYTLTKDGHAFAQVAIQWPHGMRSNTTVNTSLLEQAWLFHKLTGVSREAFPNPQPEDPIAPLESKTKIRVTGTAEGLRKLAPEE